MAAGNIRITFAYVLVSVLVLLVLLVVWMDGIMVENVTVRTACIAVLSSLRRVELGLGCRYGASWSPYRYPTNNHESDATWIMRMTCPASPRKLGEAL